MDNISSCHRVRAMVALAFCVLGLALYAVPAVAGTGTAGGAWTAALRTETPLTQGWRFRLDDALDDDQALKADTAAWEAVALPHTWNALDAATTAQTTPGSRPYRRGIGWYLLRFDAPAGPAGTRWLHFDAASITATVWLNGRPLGRHQGAFTAFRFDVTDGVKPRGNQLLVKVDNRPPGRHGSPTAIIPLSGDFNMSGGLYRGVRLITTPHAAHVALDDHAGPGVYATTTRIDEGWAELQVLTRLRQTGGTLGRYRLRTRLLAADGQPVAVNLGAPATLQADGRGTIIQALRIARPRLWEGQTNPYLYRLVVDLLDDRGRPVDRVIQAVGLRTVAVDAARGFLLNGTATPLRGVNLHQDFQGKGWAISSADTDASLSIVREMGANALRLAHYPHAADTYRQADQLGLTVMAELPFVNSSAIAFYGPGQCDQALADPELNGVASNARLQLTEMVRQLYNHPSIAFWSLANEVTTFACGQTADRNNVTPLLRSLQAVAKAEDPSRITTAADQASFRNDQLLADPIPLVGLTDGYAVNRYFQWYYGTSDRQLADHLDDLHARHPDLPLGVTEYGAGSALSHQTDNPRGGRPCFRDFTGARRVCPQPEGYAAHVHEQSLGAISARPFLFGSFVWNMFDFGSGIRHEGDIGATNTKGLVSFDRHTRKDSFYLFKANWSGRPVTHIVGRRHTERAYPSNDVVVYSNADRTQLMLEDRVLQVLTAAQCPMAVCTFRNLQLPVGRSMLSAIGQHGTAWLTDAVHWRLAPDNAENVYIAAGQLLSGVQSDDALLGRHRYGSDNFFDGGTTSPLAYNGPVNGIDERAVPSDPRVWDHHRAGKNFSYRLPWLQGRYKVTLGFMATDADRPQGSVLDVLANGDTVIRSLDIATAAGRPFTAVTRSFVVDAADQGLHLQFVALSGEARVSNLQIVREPTVR